MKVSKALSGISRRDLFRLTGQFGLSSVVFGAGALTGAVSLPSLARAAETSYDKRFAKEAKHTLKLGAAGFNARNLLIERAGVLEFARDLEERTEGEIRVEFIGDNQICGQLNCVEKTQTGVIDMYAASTQNSAGGAPYLNVLDYAYMFPSRAAQYHFLYSPASQRVLREPLEKRHGLKFLFSHCELRGIQLGNNFADKPTVTKLEELFGTKNRVTGTQLGRIAMQQLNLNPVPVAWEETLDGLKQGLIDGAETWASAVAYANMSPVVSQSVDLQVLLRDRAHLDVGARLRRDGAAFAGCDHGIGLSGAGPCAGGERGGAGQDRGLLGPAASRHDLCRERRAPRLPRRGSDQDGRGNVLARVQPRALGTVARAAQQLGRGHRHLSGDLRRGARDPHRYAARECRAAPLVARGVIA